MPYPVTPTLSVEAVHVTSALLVVSCGGGSTVTLPGAVEDMQRAIELGLAVHLLPKWYDVDDRATLHWLCGELFDGKSGSTTDNAPATREFLSGIIEREGRARIWPEIME